MMLKLFIKPLIWLTIIFYGLFIPSTNLPKKPFFAIPHFDKMVHFGLFFIFCLLLFVPFKKMKTNYMLVAPLIAIILSAILETTQQLISPTRSSNFYDFMANTLGILASIIVFHFLISEKKWEKYF
jgi:VanZ family protein